MKSTIFCALAVALACVMAHPAFAADLGPNAYATAEQMGAMSVVPATVVNVRAVQVRANPGRFSTGSLLGGAIGAVVGRSAGGGNGKILTTLIGAVAGSIAGQSIESAARSSRAYLITVRLADGRMLAVVQRAQVGFMPGQKVALMRSPAGNLRVEPISPF